MPIRLRSQLIPHGPELRERLAGNLAAFERRAIDAEGLRPAAVAIVISPHRKRPT